MKKIIKREKIQELRKEMLILDTLKIKPNYSDLSRRYHVDRRTVKKYDLGYDGERASTKRISKLDKYKDEIKEAVKNGVFFLLICGAYQLFGKYYKGVEGNIIKRFRYFSILYRSGSR